MRYAVDTKLSADEIFERAKAYFGPEGAGLELEEGTPGCCAHFATNLGHVHLEIREAGKKTTAELETVEYDIQVRDFMKRLTG